jgi:hypothetical protein
MVMYLHQSSGLFSLSLSPVSCGGAPTGVWDRLGCCPETMTRGVGGVSDASI